MTDERPDREAEDTTILPPTGERPDRAAEDTTAPPAGQDGGDRWIAGYRIVGKLGEGGMGVVYEVEQQSPRRPVALKVIRGGPCVDEYTIKLFQREVQTLARLKHPGIAAIHEAGRTPDGQRFFAMELVRGTPLNEYARKHPLAGSDLRRRLRERLRLFLHICEAINYAHQRAVIHRDLKPSNILVISGGDAPQSPSGMAGPRVKILDFGLARITDSDVAATTVVTAPGSIAGTLEYMSPEQARGNPDEIDLRSDVYSLGVLLYELVTDDLPYHVQRSQLPEAVRVICEEAPQRPSAVHRILRGDLETIVLKALDKEPARRYQSALALAEDVERYLADQPILARPPSTIYQLRKLVSRHRTGFTLGAALCVLLVASTVMMSVMLGVQRRERLRADAARAEAQQEARKAEQVSTFLREMLSSVDPRQARGEEVSVREALDAAAEQIDTGLAAEPEVQAAVRRTIGMTYRALGLYEAAEVQFQRALDTRRRLHGTEHPEVAVSMSDLACLLSDRGEFERSERLHRQALELVRRLYSDEHHEVARACNDLGAILWEQERLAEAEPLFRDALRIWRQVADEDDLNIPVALNNLSLVIQDQGRYAEGEPYLQEAVERWRTVYGDDHPQVAGGLNNLAVLFYQLGRHAEAESLYRETLVLRRKLLGDEHPRVGLTLHNLGSLLEKMGQYEEAERLLGEAVQIWRASLGDEHQWVVNATVGLGTIYRNQGRYAEAETHFLRALELDRKQYGAEHPRIAGGFNNLALLRGDQGNWDEAESLYRQALAMYKRVQGEEGPGVGIVGTNLGVLLADRGRYAEAEALLREALEVKRKLAGDDDRGVTAATNRLAEILRLQDRYAEAEALYRETLEINLRVRGEMSTPTAASLLGLGMALLDSGRPEEADPHLRQSVDIYCETEGQKHWRTAVALAAQGSCRAGQGRYATAESLLVAAWDQLQSTAAPALYVKRDCLQRVIGLYEAWQKPDRAAGYRAELERLGSGND